MAPANPDKHKYRTLLRIALLAAILLGALIVLALCLYICASAGFDRHMMGIATPNKTERII